MKTPYYSTHTRERNIRKEWKTEEMPIVVKPMHDRTTEPILKTKWHDWVVFLLILLLYISLAFFVFFHLVGAL